MLFLILTVGLLGAGAHVLVRRMMRGDRRATATLLARVAPVIRARCLRTIRRWGGTGDADDLAQEVWLMLLADGARALLDFDPQRNVSFEGYVGMLSEREAGKVLRKGRALKRGGHLRIVEMDESIDGRHEGPGPLIEARDLAARLSEHLERVLPPKGRLVFAYLFSDGCTVAQTADALGVNTQVVYNCSHRIRSEARSFLQSHPAAA